MKKTLLVLAILAIASMPAFAQVGKGLSGPHWNLNIIGVPHDKTADMTNSNRHTIFVPLNTEGDVPRDIKIYYVINEDNPDKFEVLDGNATDGEATIAVPYEYCDPYEEDCTELLNFNVFAVGLGKPNGYAIVTAECTYDDEVDIVGDLTCTDTLLMGEFTINRTNGGKNKPKSTNISNIFRATGCIDVNDSDICDTGDIEFKNVWVFNLPWLESYMWDYDNYGLKLMQVRFYETSFGSIEIVP